MWCGWHGSYSGGIFIVAMDPATGFPKPGQGYGRHLLGGHHARIGAPYVLYNAQTRFYYLFTCFGGLDAAGGYNIRVARSRRPDGPYFDAAGHAMSQVKGNPDVPFDDSRIAPYGQKLMGNYQLVLAAGETGTPLGYVSPGHYSALYEAATGQYFLVFHTTT
jgi:arabinan endo-1,5-alpha-L-arabinosidase